MVIYKSACLCVGSRVDEEEEGQRGLQGLRAFGNTGWLFVAIPRQVRQDKSFIERRLAWLGWLEVSGLQYSGVEGGKGQSKRGRRTGACKMQKGLRNRPDTRG